MSLLLSTPCYGGMVTTHYLQSALDTQVALTEAGLAHDWLFAWNESLVQRARNKLVRSFLETDYRKLLFIDADIQFRAEHVAALWNLQDSASITVGAYPMKRLGAPVSAWLEDGPVELEHLAGPTPVTYAGTGFMMIDRGVFEALKSPEIEHQEAEGTTWAFFDCHIRDGCYLSEDYWFCRSARAAGFEILLDPSIDLVHWGTFGYGAPRDG